MGANSYLRAIDCARFVGSLKRHLDWSIFDSTVKLPPQDDF